MELDHLTLVGAFVLVVLIVILALLVNVLLKAIGRG